MKDQRIYEFGPFTLLPERQALLRGDTRVRIGSRAFDLLTALVERAGDVVSKAELTARAWPTTTVDDANLKVNMAALRRVLESHDNATEHIATVTGRGYRFVCPVQSGGSTHAAPYDDSVRHNLPTSATRIFGRSENIASTLHDLSESRLVSLVGPGGIGKTTVAVAVAEQLIATTRDGVWLIDLSATRDPELVPSLIGTVLGISTPAGYMLEAICGYLRDRDVVLVLDSCEHVIDAAASCASRVLASAPAITILVTSREPLDVSGERVRRLQGLDTPPEAPELSAEQAAAFPAVQLFVERATDKLETFVLTDAQAPEVARICRRLDGLALAIELAAARVDEFGVSGVLGQLDDCFHVLRRRYAEPERHRTLAAALDWSYRLLPPEEARFLRIASVFSGAFGVDDIRRVADSEVGEAARTLSRLAAKSLLSTDIDASGVEYRLLETTRAFCLDRLESDLAESAFIRGRHAELVCDKLERASKDWSKLSALAWSATYGRVLADLRSALAWANAPPERPSLRIRLTVAGLLLWNNYSLTEESRGHAARAIEDLSAAGQVGTAAEMHLKTWLGSATMFTGGLSETALKMLQNGMGLAIQLGDDQCHMRCLRALGLFQHLSGQHVAGATTFEAFRALATRIGTPDAPEVEHQIAISEYFLGRLDSARRRLERLHADYTVDAAKSQTIRHLTDMNSAVACALAMTEWLTGSADSALRLSRETVAYALETNHHLSLSDALNVACPLLYWAGLHDEADECIDMFDDLGSRHGIATRRPVAKFYLAALKCDRKGPAAGLQDLSEAIESFRTVGHMARMPYYLGFLAEVQSRCGRLEEADANSEAALSLAHSQSEGWCLPEVYRVRAAVLHQSGRTDQSIALLHRAMSVAAETGGLWMGLRAAIDLSELQGHAGEAAAAHALLSGALSALAGGDDTADVRRAHELLERLEASRVADGSGFNPA